MKFSSTISSTGEPAGLSVNEFARRAGISRTTFYMLEDRSKPTCARIGRRVVVTEEPASWLDRVTRQGGAKTLRD